MAAAATAVVQRQREYSVQQQGEAAGVSGVAAVCKMRSQRVVAQTAAQQAAATAAETVQCRKLTAFLKPTATQQDAEPQQEQCLAP